MIIFVLGERESFALQRERERAKKSASEEKTKRTTESNHLYTHTRSLCAFLCSHDNNISIVLDDIESGRRVVDRV